MNKIDRRVLFNSIGKFLIFFSLFIISLNLTVKLEASYYNSSEIVVSQVDFVISGFKNAGPDKYLYLKTPLTSALEEGLKRVPFFTLTDDQRVQIKNSICFLEKGSDPVVIIKNKLEPVITRNSIGGGYLTIRFSGIYRVSEDYIEIWVSAESREISFYIINYYLKVRISEFIEDPEATFIPFVKSILNYRVFEANFFSTSDNSLIFIDEKLVGFGNARHILLEPGIHKLLVISEGYTTYHEIINVNNDGFSKIINLNKYLNTKKIEIVTEPSEVEVYLNEKYIGLTPLNIYLNDEDVSITLKKEGYEDRVIYLKKSDKNNINVKMVASRVINKKRIIAEKNRNISRILYYSGLGLSFLAVISGSTATYYNQKSELYRDIDNSESDKAERLSHIYTGLTVASSALAVIVFTFSFEKLLSYFNLYAEEGK